ncbi:MAG: LysM peptidoglycan-binding domain-containing protein [Chloroflexota bacterium]
MQARQHARTVLTKWVPAALALLLTFIWVGVAIAESYVVKSGDTLYGIGMKYAVEPGELARANGIPSSGILQIGQKLDIPQSQSGSQASTPANYAVVPGDTLSGIADRFGVSEDALIAANSITNREYLYAGQKLVIPSAGSAATAAAPAQTGPAAYIIDIGDTLSGIADRFGLSSTAVASANGLANPNSLRVGQRLTIPNQPQVTARGGRRASFVWPTFGEITTYFHEVGPYWVAGWHEGLDIAAASGTIIRAAEDGMVVESEDGWNRGYGNYVKIDHGNGLVTLYAHMSERGIAAYKEVKRGDVIGYVGSTGASTGPHLHFEVRIDGEKKDPLLYLP